MRRLHCLLSVLSVLAISASPVNPLHGADNTGRWGLGLYGGAAKLVLTDHSDLWTPAWLVGADLKYGLAPTFTIGVEGTWRQHYLANLDEPEEREDGAKLTTDNVTNGPRQRDFTAGLFAEYHVLAGKTWSPYICAGTGVYIWKWADKDWNTLTSDSASSGSAATFVDSRIPPVDKAGNVYDLKDQQLYVMGGLGLEVFPTEALSLELGAKYRHLTSVLSDFKDDKDIVGSDPGQLDLPKGTVELFAGLTFYFGGAKYIAPTATTSAYPLTGTVPLSVAFTGGTTGGRPDYTYSWNFGDGTTSAEQNPNHTYETPGSYLATLTSKDSKGITSQSSVAVTVSCPAIDCTASANPPSGTVPLTVQFGASANGGCPPIKYSWDFGDGGSSTEQNPSHAFATAGDFAAALTVTDAMGNTCRKTVSVKCEAEEFIPTPEKPVILKGVNFELNKAVLTAEATQILDRVAASLLTHPEVKVEVGGHTDSDGSEAYNIKLSSRRAKSVQDYLIKKGIPASQLVAKGYGESQPVADNKTAEGRAENRRVELKRL